MRKWIIQIHLWSALVCSLYIVLISLTGSAVVMRREFGRWFAPPNFIQVGQTRLSDEELTQIAASAYPNATDITVGQSFGDRVPVSITLVVDGRELDRRFNPYTGENLGDPFPAALAAMAWLVDLHDNLLSGTTGRKINGIGGAAFALIILTGAFLWWPGRRRWTKSLTVSFSQRGYLFLWRLHSTLGFWSFGLLFVWAITAVYFAFPIPFEEAIDHFDPDLEDFHRPGEAQLLGLIAAHFGRFGPLPVRFIWMAAGLIPIALLVTGVWMWLIKRRAPDPVSSS